MTHLRTRKTRGVDRDSSGERIVVRSSAVRNDFADYCSRVFYNRIRVVVSRGRKPVAVLVSPADLELLEKLEDAMDLEAARAALEDVEKHGSVPWEKVKAKLGLA